jgi:phosphomannomutase
MTQQSPLMLSVSGARGIVGETMTPLVAADFAIAFGSFLMHTTGQASPMLCVGRDSRPSGEMLAFAAMTGLASLGCRVIDLGVVATPTVAVMIDKHRAAGAVGGLAITASHNPIQWNGIKCLNADGVAPPPDQAQEIIRRFKEKDIQFPANAPVHAILSDASANDTHVQRVLANIPDVNAIRSARLKVVLDSVNGGGCVSGRMLLESLGCEVVHINGEPTGQFAHTPEPTQENLRDLAVRTAQEKAAIGFAQDPDADRLAIIDEKGTYIGEEYTLVLAAKRLLENGTPAPRAGSPGSENRGTALVLAANLSTSRMIDDVAAQYGAKVIRTAVGEANVVAALQAHGANTLLGGEGNGGVIFPPVCWVRDSLSAMALTLGLLAAERQPLSAIVRGLPKYHMIKHKFDLAKIGGLAAVKPALEKVTERFADARISTLDGVRLDFADGWVHLRPSNTEPIVRLIAEARTESRAWEMINEVAAAAGLN